ncbi:mitochondrial ubiquitin ligase activator of nfkb 1-A-like, partial [Arapaima gigas]
VFVPGVVQPEGVPLTSQYASRCTGVIQKVVVCKHRRVWDSVTRLWSTRTVNQEETTRSVPFCLVAPGSSAGGILVKVREPQKAEGLDMERVYKHQQPITNGLADFALLGLTRLRSVTWEVKEEMLRVGTVMTAMGEVVLEGGRVLRLQPPEDGHRYCLYPQSYESFLQTHHKVANMWKWLAGANGITGASLLTWAIYRGLGNTKRGG